jgi:DNA-binding response OmpR family regulator
VLLVEDEPQVAKFVSNALETSGYAVLQVPEPSKALELIENSAKRIDLLLTDVVMPEMNVRQLPDSARRARPGLRVLYMSSYSDDAILRRGVQTSTVHFIQKPFSIDALIAKTREALDRPAPA